MSSSPSCKFYGRKLKGMMVRCNRIRSFDKSVQYSIRFVFHTCGKMGLDLPMGLLLYDWFSSGLINVANGLFVSQVASLFVERLAKSCAVHKSSQLPSIYWYAKVNIRYQMQLLHENIGVQSMELYSKVHATLTSQFCHHIRFGSWILAFQNTHGVENISSQFFRC